ncbi:unnamed protein product [Rhizoctonia solani]|uniref:AIG1-type G domain-containing protein n=1 Tax=Rhizoctonia solani TaxID=456999 RepID=A0A8H3HLS3_9AGAM|nr:unnamed protein product [Rhizoctonia solani]
MTQTTPNHQEVEYDPQPTDTTMEWESVNAPTGRSKFHFPQKKNVLTILLIGETGSGKTSFMSLVLNLFQGNGPFELEDKHFVDAQSGLNRSQSQTTEARLYSFTTSDGIKVEVLDTPGLADTRGIEEDKRHKERIYRAIQDLITVIDGVMIIANGRVERLSVATDYTLNILATLFPRSIVDNIGIIFTNTGAGGAGLNFQIQSLPLELRKAEYWCLDNPLSLYKNYSAQKAANGFRRGQESKQQKNLETSYLEATETLDDWLEWLDDRREIPTTAIIELYQKSAHIESRLFETIISIANLSKLESQLLNISPDLETAGKEKENLAKLQNNLPPKVWVLKETSNHNTICTAADCHSNCHTECSLELGDPATIGGSCKAFKTLGIPNRWLPFWSDTGVKCGQVKCGHEARFHRYYQKIHRQIDSTAYKRIVQDLKHVTTEKERLESIKTRVEQEIEQVKRAIQQSKVEIPRLVEELNGLSLSPNYTGYIWSALDILNMRREQLMQRGDSGNELAVINDGIKAFEAQLDLLRENEAGRIVKTSDEQVKSDA